MKSTPKYNVDKLNAFKGYRIRHKILNDVLSEVAEKIECPSQALCLIGGPTGVGKTTLIQALMKQTLEDHAIQMHEDKSFIPISYALSKSPENGNFGWRDLYKRLLKSMREPLIEHKVCDKANWAEWSSRSAVTVDDLRFALESCLRHRKVKVVVIDEAQHMRKLPSGRRLLDQMDALKSLADNCGVQLILAGTYEVSDFLNINGQLARRTACVHFPRYVAENYDDFCEFKRAIVSFQNHLPNRDPIDLLAIADYLYTRSAGCVGSLKEWLDRACHRAMRRGEILSADHLQKTSLSTRSLLKIAREINEGERTWSETAEDEVELKQLLKVGPPSKDPIRTKSLPKGLRVGERKKIDDPAFDAHV